MLRLACGILACAAWLLPWLQLSLFEQPMWSLVVAAGLAAIGLVGPRLFGKAAEGDVLERVGAVLCSLSLLAVVATFAFVARFCVALD